MSFSNPFQDDIENDASSNHYKDFPEFETLSQAIDNNLHNINNSQLVSMRNLLGQYEKLLHSGNDAADSGSSKVPQEILEVSTKCTESFKKINNLAKELNDYLTLCEDNHEDPDALRYLRQKEGIHVSLIRSSLQQYRRLQQRYSALQKQFVTKIPANQIEERTVEEQGAGPQQQSIQIEYEPVNAEELEQQTLLIEEREREIQQISQDTQEINDIFSNLQDIIQEQLFQIDTIEENINSYSADARGASGELRKAERYQRRSSGRMCCCLIILLSVLGSIIFISIVL